MTLGQTAVGTPVHVNLSGTRTCHALISGTTGSGKTVTEQLIAWTLATDNDPRSVRLLLVDGKGGTSWWGFEREAHLAHPVIGDPGEAVALASLRALLAGGAPVRRPYQAPVSWRILPRVLGQAVRALRQAEEVAAISLSAVSDNPVFIPPGPGQPHGRVLANGGYHNARVAPALDALAASAADLALLADRQTTKLLDGKVSLLPDQLLPAGPAGAADGTFLGCLAMTALGYAEQARAAARTTLLPGSEGGGFGQNDVASVAFPAWRRQDEAGTCLTATLAALAVVASQALHVTGRPAPPALVGLLETVRQEVPVVLTPRALGPEVGRLHARFEAQTTALEPEPWLAGVRLGPAPAEAAPAGIAPSRE